LYYFNANHLGSGSLITDENGNTYQTLAYAPYGEDLVNIRQAGNYEELRQFGGHYLDEESGLLQAEARYYSPPLSIPISTDPHWYNYPHITSYNWCGNNPIMYNDPTGMDGEVTGEGTKDNPYVIHAAYYYQNGSLSDTEVQGLTDARDAYNNAGTMNVKGVGMIKYNIEVQGVDDSNAAKMATEFTDKNGESRWWGNEVKTFNAADEKLESSNNYGSSTKNYIGYVPENIQNGLNEDRNSSKFYKGIMIHEMGHNLGGEHSAYNDNSVMDTRGSINGFFIYPQIDGSFKSFTKDIFGIKDKYRPFGSVDGRIWTRGR
jgi:RHS repeat-associated protein